MEMSLTDFAKTLISSPSTGANHPTEQKMMRGQLYKTLSHFFNHYFLVKK